MNSHLGWALIRFVFGMSLAFAHGLPKLQGGVERFAEGVAKIGFPAPTFFAWCAILAELVGGILVAIGLFTRPAAAFAAFTMLVAASRHINDPFRQLESSLLFLTVFVAAVLAGSGKFGLDAKLKLPGVLGRLQR